MMEKLVKWIAGWLMYNWIMKVYKVKRVIKYQSVHSLESQER